jgi:DNA repair exonuclease SbcCD ATPase subunit
MKLNRVEVEGFRTLKKESFNLKDLTIFSGEMGSGKTSRLLSILFNLSGSAPSGINLDEMINVDSDYMWVKTLGTIDGKSFFIERSKRLDRSTTIKTDKEDIPNFGNNIFIEGREIAKLFLGAPTEKTLRIDSLLGLSKYSQTASEISTAYLEQRIANLMDIQKQIHQISELRDNITKVEEELELVSEKINKTSEELSSNTDKYSNSEEIIRKFEVYSMNIAEINSKRALIKEYENQIKNIPIINLDDDESINELKAKYDASQKRVAFLEAVMQILDIDGRTVENISTCPVCGALISTKALDKFVHFDKEYRYLMNDMTHLEVEWKLISEKIEKSRNSKNQIKILQDQITKLNNELESLSIIEVSEDSVLEAKETLKKRVTLHHQERELQIRKRSLEEQVKGYSTIYNRIYDKNKIEIETKIEKLVELKERLQRIKRVIIETINEVRISQIENLRKSFKETFRKIYPYDRFDDIDFESIKFRGKEHIQVKAKLENNWIYPNQMSTGENVAISFALLFAANKIESSPILLFDEPEEGLDENGVNGLGEILKTLKDHIQIIVATRNVKLAEFLRN